MGALSGNASIGAPMVAEDQSVIVKSAAEMYDNAIAAIETATGKLKPYAAASGEIPAGIHVGRKTGAADGSVVGSVDGRGKILTKVTVTGAAAQTDLYKTVYKSTDNPAEFTLTSGGAPLGRISKWHSSTTCDVELFANQVTEAIALAGSHEETITATITAGIAASGYLLGDATHGLPFSGHGIILAAKLFCIRAPTDIDLEYAVTLRINNVAVTGISAVILHGDALGAEKDGGSATAANEFHNDDKLQIYGTQTTPGTATDPGEYLVSIKVRYLPGL